MCFSATANFVGSRVLGAVGVVTLTKVKHRRELLFAAAAPCSSPFTNSLRDSSGWVWMGSGVAIESGRFCMPRKVTPVKLRLQL
jgi:hypothetical protein